MGERGGRGGVASKAIIGGTITVIVTIITFVSNHYIQGIQQKEMKFSLYTELMAQREQAESALRKDMFTSIIGSFLKPDSTSLEAKVLNLELLSYNFHESLDLHPLFLHLDREIQKRDFRKSEDSAQVQNYRERLVRAAREVKQKQISALANGPGEKIDFVIPRYARLCAAKDTAEYPVTDSTLCYHFRSRCQCCLESDKWYQPDRDTLTCLQFVYHFCRVINSVPHSFEIKAFVPYDTMEDLSFAVTIKIPKDKKETRGDTTTCIFDSTDKKGDDTLSQKRDTPEKIIAEELDAFLKSGERPADTTEVGWAAAECCVGEEPFKIFTGAFHVGEFDFPLIDNSRLQKDHRFALVLEEIDQVNDTAANYEMVLVCFPGSRAGLKDKPYIDDIVDKLVKGK